MPAAKEKVSYFYDGNTSTVLSGCCVQAVAACWGVARSDHDGVAETIGSYYYGAYHPMKPFRITMAHHLVLAYDLHKHLDVFKPPRATEGTFVRALRSSTPEPAVVCKLAAALREFHDSDYVQFLQTVNPDVSALAPISSWKDLYLRH